MFAFLFLTFFEDKKYCLVQSTRFKGECKGYTDIVVLDRFDQYTFQPSISGHIEIFVHSSIRSYENIEFTHKQVNQKSYHFSGSSFTFVYKENDLSMKAMHFDSATKIIFYGTKQSTFIIEDYSNEGEIEFRDKIKRNLITIKNFSILNTFRTSMVAFPIYDELFENPTFKLEVLLEENDVVEITNDGILASEIFINTKKFKSILFRAKTNLRLTKSAPDPVYMYEMPSIEFSSPDAFIVFNPIWGAAPVTTSKPGTIKATKSIIIDFENIEDITLPLFKIESPKISKRPHKYGGNFCFYTSKMPENKNCACVKYNPGTPITYPIPATLKIANFLIYDTATTQATIDALYFAGRSISIVGADLITKVAIDLSRAGPAHLFLENMDLELIGSELKIQNLTIGPNVYIDFKEEQPIFDVTTLECIGTTDFFQYCKFHCHNLIIPSDNFNLIDELDDDQVDNILVTFKEGHQIKELVFRQNIFQIQVAGNVYRIPNQQLYKLSFILPFQQNVEIKIKSILPYEYKLEYFPRITYLNDSSVNYYFDESWEDSNIGIKSKRGDFFHPTKINYINSKSSIKKLLEIFDLKEYMHSDRTYSSGYCISDDASQCGPDHQVIPNSDKVLSRIFLPDPYGDCVIKVVSPNVILDMHCFSGINVRLYSSTKRSITLLFRPNVIIPKLEIDTLTANFRTVEKMDSIIIGTLISDTSEIQTASMNTPLDIHNLMKILAFAYINIVPYLTPSTTRKIELVSSDEYPPISNLIVCPDHFVFEMTSKYSVIANFSMFSSISYIHASQKATKITIAPSNRFGAFLSKMPDLEFLSLSTYISFSEDWFELNPIVSSKGHITTRHLYPAKVFTPRNIIPDIFIFDQKPIINFFSDSSICLYKSSEKICPDSYIPYKYTSKKITMKMLDTYTKQLTLFIADSTPSDMPTIDEDVASLDKLTITARWPQFIAIHAEKVIKTLNLINTSIYVFSETNIPVYNLSMIGVSNIYSDTMNISHATLSLDCYKNIYSKLKPTTEIIILDDNMSTIFFGNDIVYINEIPIEYTYYDTISITILHTVIFSPHGTSYMCRKPLNLDFAGNDPSVTFDAAWEMVPSANQTNAILISDVPIKIFGVLHDGFKFEKEYLNSAAKICVFGQRDNCPSGYTKLQYTGRPLIVDNSIHQMELLIMPEKIMIDGENLMANSLKLVSDNQKTVEITRMKMIPDFLELENISLIVQEGFRVNSIKSRGSSKLNIGFDVSKIDLDWYSRNFLNEFQNNDINNLTVEIPNSIQNIEVFTDHYVVHENNDFVEFKTNHIKSIIFIVAANYLNMSTRTTVVELIPSIIMKQGTIYFDGKWDNTKSDTHGFIRGMSEVVIDEIFPDFIYELDPTITLTMLSQDICLFSDLISSEQCPRGAKQVKYSENTIDVYAMPTVWFYICDTTPVTPLRVKSRIKFEQIEMFALSTIQDVILDVSDVNNLILNGMNLCFSNNPKLNSLKLVTSDIINTSSVKVDKMNCCGVSPVLASKNIEFKSLTITTTKMISFIVSSDRITAVDAYENVTFSHKEFDLVVTGKFAMKLAENSQKALLPNKIFMESNSSLIVDQKFDSVDAEKVPVSGDKNSVIASETGSIPQIFEIDDSVKTKPARAI